MDYLTYLRRVDVARLIEQNQTLDELRGRDPSASDRCHLCGAGLHMLQWLRLNDGKYLCGSCLSAMRRVRYPEKYQTLYEDYLAKREAHRMAEAEEGGRIRSDPALLRLEGSLRFVRSTCAAIVLLSLLAFASMEDARTSVAGIGAALLIGAVALAKELSNRRQARSGMLEAKLARWRAANPPPSQPELREFYDPKAILSTRDRAILHVLDYWPGYPPYWRYVREVVLDRDHHRCQLTGCPSRLELHVHHKVALAQGGSHKPDNLVALCAYHHAMQDDLGHNRIRGEVVTPYFTFVKPYLRSNGVRVRGHLRHKVFASEADLQDLVSVYGIVCRNCRKPIGPAIDGYKVVTRCRSCRSANSFRLSIPEEIGPRLCVEHAASKNIGAQLDWTSYLDRHS